VSGVLAINSGYAAISAGTKGYPTATLKWVCQLVGIDGKATRVVRCLHTKMMILIVLYIAEFFRDGCAPWASYCVISRNDGATREKQRIGKGTFVLSVRIAS